jgi:threonine dehydrogenase-like Zn-dependent dehydrogenase
VSLRARAVVFSGHRTLEIREYPVPDPPEGGAILQVEAVGMCHSDVDMFNGITHTRHPVFPAVPGHETVGRIARISPDTATAWGVGEGDRVALFSRLMRDGDPYVYGHDFSADVPPGLFGGYGEYMVLLPGTRVFALREDLPAEELTFFNPLGGAIGWVRAVRPGDVLVIQGPGHMGLACVIAARLAGAGTVIVTGTSADGIRLETASRIGAVSTVNVDGEDPVERVRELTGGTMADVVIDAASSSVGTVPLSLDLVRREGTVVLAGLKDHRPVELVTDHIVLRHLTVTGAVGGEIERSVAAINAGKVPTRDVLGAVYPLEEVEEALALLDRKIPGRDAVRVGLTMAPA